MSCSCGCGKCGGSKKKSNGRSIPLSNDIVFLFWAKNPLRPTSLRRIRRVSIVGSAAPCGSLLVIGKSLIQAARCLLRNGFVIASSQTPNGVTGFIVFKRRRRGQPNSCCSDSHLRAPGIKRRSPGVYFADADLQCSGLCSGRDRDIVYDWKLTPTDKDNPGNLRIVGSSRKVGDGTVQVAGTGTFDLNVLVTFKCTAGPLVTALCSSQATVRFTQ